MAASSGNATASLKRLPSRELLRQGSAYGVIGVLQFLLDWLIYVILTQFGLHVVAANLLARAGGASAGFALNGVFTFRDRDGARLGWRRFSRFAVTWLLMALLSTLALWLIDRQFGLQVSWFAKPAVDAALAVLGFLLSRHWIYR